MARRYDNCEFCGKLLRADYLKEHIKRSHQNKKESCGYCAEEFYNQSSLKRHIPFCTANTGVVAPINTISNEIVNTSDFETKKVVADLFKGS